MQPIQLERCQMDIRASHHDLLTDSVRNSIRSLAEWGVTEFPSQGSTRMHRGTSSALAPCGGCLRSTCPSYGPELTLTLSLVQTPLTPVFVQYGRLSMKAKTSPFQILRFAPILALSTRDLSLDKRLASFFPIPTAFER